MFDNEDKNYTALCAEVYYQSKNIGYKKGQIEALLKLEVFRINARKEYSKVIASTEEVEKLALAIDDYYSICMAKVHRGYVYLYLGLFEESKNTVLSASKYISLVKDTAQRQNINVNSYFILGSIYDEFEDMKNCIYYNKKMFEEANKMDDSNPGKLNWMLNGSRCLVVAYINNGQYKEAGYYLKIQEKYITKNSNIFDLAVYHKSKAQFESKNKENNRYYLDSAIHHFKEAEVYAKKSNNEALLKYIYNDLADVYAEKKDVNNRVKYLEKTNSLKDSLDIVRKRNLQEVSLKVDEKQKSPETFSKSNYPIIILLIALAIISFWVFKKYELSRNKSSISDIKITDNFSEIKQEDALSISQLFELAMSNDPSFYHLFLKTFSGFDKKLLEINPTMKVSDIEICAFIKLNIDTKQIATIKKMTVGAVEAKKYRIRRKLNISSDENMYIWISRI